MNIQGAHSNHLGDLIWFASMLAALPAGEEILIADRDAHGEPIRPLMDEILWLMPLRSPHRFVEKPGRQDYGAWDFWSKNLVPPLRLGSGVAYQFDGVSSPSKNPSDIELEDILWHLAPWGPCRLGKPLTLAEDAQILRESRLFIGCDSGMANLCALVGTPMIVYLPPHHPDPVFAPGKPQCCIGIAATAADLIRMATEFLGYRHCPSIGARPETNKPKPPANVRMVMGKVTPL